METLRFQLANTCKHINGIGNKCCEANIEYSKVIHHSENSPSERPCFKDNKVTFLCKEAYFLTDEEVQAELVKIDEIFTQVALDLKNDICPTCK